VLREAGQLRGEAAKLPAVSKNYDVEQKGRFSAGQFGHPKAGKTSSKKRHAAKLPIEVPKDDRE
jgi:hypothetical protein